MAPLSVSSMSVSWVRLRWHTRRTFQSAMRRFGVRTAALIVSGLAALASVLVMTQLQKDWQALEKSVQLLGATPPAGQPPIQVRDMQAETLEALARFEARLPNVSDVPQSLADLFEIASSQKLVLLRGEYKWQTERHGAFQRYQMSLPVRGDPQAIQDFIRLAMIELPTLSFEAIQIKRDRIVSAPIQI